MDQPWATEMDLQQVGLRDILVSLRDLKKKFADKIYLIGYP